MKKSEKKKIYLALLPKIIECAKSCGYAIGLHGSLTRDMDLIAVPWVEKNKPESVLVKRITKAVNGLYVPSNTKKPHGRNAHTIILKGYGGEHNLFIDLSVMPEQSCSSPITSESSDVK